MFYRRISLGYTIAKGVIFMDAKNIEVGKRITETRKCRGYTREKLSELAEVSVQFLSEIEKGRKTMTVTTLRKVAAALNVTTDYIVNGAEPFDENQELNTMLASMSRENRKQAEKLLTIFIETINFNRTKE